MCVHGYSYLNNSTMLDVIDKNDTNLDSLLHPLSMIMLSTNNPRMGVA